MTDIWLRLTAAILLLVIFAYMFALAWRNMKRADRMAQELAKTRQELKQARDDSAEWQAVADDLAAALARRAS